MLKKSKSIFTLLILAILLIAVPFVVNAEEGTTIQKQIENVQNGATIKLTSNVTEDIVIPKDKNIILDLGDFNLTNKDTGKHTITVEEGATLTINGQKGKVTNTNPKDYAPVANNGKLIINGGNYYLDKNSSFYVILNHGVAEINGGEFKTIGGDASLIDNGWYTANDNKEKKYATLTINNGKFIMENNNKYIKNDDFGKMYINGGNFIMNNPASAIIANVGTQGEEELIVKDGNFEGNPRHIIWAYSKAKTQVFGGTSNKQIESKCLAEGMLCGKVGDKYVVDKEQTITVKKSQNGKVTASAEKAIKGEEITLTVKADEGFALQSLVVMCENTKINVTDGKFTMPAGNVEIEAIFDVPVVDGVTETVNSSEPVEEVTLGTDEKAIETTKKVLEETFKKEIETNAELKAATENKNVLIVIDVKKIEKLDEETTKKIQELLGKNCVLNAFEDVNINVFADGDIVGNLKELKEKITLTVVLPEDLQAVKKGMTRTYYAVRVHEGKIEKLPVKLAEDGKSLTFETDKFSTYALAYEDSEVKSNNPQTFDNIMIYVSLLALSVVGVVAGIVYLRKRA